LALNSNLIHVFSETKMEPASLVIQTIMSTTESAQNAQINLQKKMAARVAIKTSALNVNKVSL
jgi:hypothetical protein